MGVESRVGREGREGFSHGEGEKVGGLHRDKEDSGLPRGPP